MLLICTNLLSEPNYNWLDSSFSDGSFKSMVKAGTHRKEAQEVITDSHSPDPVPATTDEQQCVFSCPQDGCVRVFKRHSALEKHLLLEKCSKSLERYSLFDLAKLGYQSRLESGLSSVPTVMSDVAERRNVQESLNEGWALRATKKSYRFSEQQKKYLDAKFEIGRSTGRKLNGEVVARQMRRALDSDGKRLFTVNEFLSPQQISSYFSRLAAKHKRGEAVDDNDVMAYEEEGNLDDARTTVEHMVQLQHPICYDQFDICTMVANGSIEKLKLPLLQIICKGLELAVPAKDVRKKVVYLTLLTDATSRCSCRNRDTPE